MREFTLHILPSTNGHYGIEVRQSINGGTGPQEAVVVRAWGAPFQAATSQVLDAIRRSGYRASDLSRGRKAPFALKEEWGVRVALLLMALKPLRKSMRMEQIAEAIREMSDEECYYWFSKCVKSSGPRRAQRALRTLLAE
ncbi:MAG: hypothetical protein QN178_16390 [Armatimonadota bacterium]|nr:hypothetical protein [Armatimonadota bacterium]